MKRYSVFLSFTLAAAGGFALASALLPLKEPQSSAVFRQSPPADVTGVSAAPPPPAAPVIKGAADLPALMVEDDYYATQANLWEALRGMDAAAVGKLAKELSLLPRGEPESAAQAVWERWAQVDFEAAEAFFPSVTNLQVKIYAGYTLLNRLALTDPARAERIIEAGAADRSYDGVNARENLLYRIARDKPEEAARRFGEPFYAGLSSGQYIAQLWAEKDPDAALAWVRTLPEERGRAAALAEVLRAQVKKDPAAAQAIVDSAPEDQRPALSAALAEGWLKADDAGALAWVQSLTDPRQRAQAWEGYLRAKTRGDSAAAAAVLQTLPEMEREALRYRVLETLNNSSSIRIYGEGNIFHPADLLRDAAPGAMLEAERAVKIMNSLGMREEYGRALNWALSLGRDDAAMAAAGTAVSRVLEKDLPAVAQSIDALENPDRRLPLQEKVAVRWVREDFPAAEAWMRSLPAEDQAGVREVLIQAAKPEESAPLLAETLQADPAAANDPAWRRSVTALYNHWAYQDGPAAAASAENLPPGDNRAEALRQVRRRWEERDATAAGEWLRTLPPEDRAALEISP